MPNRPPPRATLLALFALTACGGADLMIVFPTASFVPEPPDGTRTTAQAPVVTAPADASFLAGETTSWHVDLTPMTDMVVNQVLVYVESWEDGHHEIPVSEEDPAAGGIDVPVSFEAQEGQTICNRDYRGVGTCYTELSVGTTDLGFVAAHDPDPASGVGGAGMSWGEPVVSPLVVEEAPDEPDPVTYGVCSDMVAIGCGCSTLQSCCTATACGYLVDGTSWYPCSGTDCGAAAAQVTSLCVSAC